MVILECDLQNDQKRHLLNYLKHNILRNRIENKYLQMNLIISSQNFVLEHKNEENKEKKQKYENFERIQRNNDFC